MKTKMTDAEIDAIYQRFMQQNAGKAKRNLVECLEKKGMSSLEAGVYACQAEMRCKPVNKRK